MDEIVARPRYSRRSAPVRKRKRGMRETGTFLESFMRQLVFALIILTIIAIIKSVNMPVTIFFSEKIKNVLAQDYNLKEIYTKANGILSKILTDKARKVPETGNTDNKDTSAVKYSFEIPVEGKVTSGFGQRIHPAFKTESIHTGIDIGAEKGTPIKAALDGKVVDAGNSDAYGKYVKIEHEGGIITLYGHCSQLLVKEGQNVNKGEIVAKVGNTGISVGTHLHFEIWKDNKPLDPREFIKVWN